jgi:hypothetical protein
MAVVALTLTALLPARTAAAQCGYSLAGWEAELEYSAPYGIDGVGVIVDAGTIRVDNFSYNGTGPDVYFYLGRSRSQNDLENGIAISGQLDRAYSDETVELTVPPSVDLAEYRALSVWCRAFSVDFSSATFEPTTPVAPTNLVASAGCDDAVDLSWSHAGGAEEFLVERRSSGTWGIVAVVASDACGFADTGLTAGATYEYRITASNDAGMSPPSGVASATNSPVFCDGFESGDTSSWSPTARP